METEEKQEEQTDQFSEFTEAETTAESPVQDAPAQEQKEEEPPAAQWDAERQRADQAEANFRKVQRERQDMESKLTQAAEKARQLEEKLSQFTKDNEVDLDAIDPVLADPNLVKVLKSMKSQLDLANQKVRDLEEKAVSYEKTAAEKEAASRQEAAKSEILSDIEKEFSPKYRNQALEMANKICADRGYAPVDRYEAAKMLRDCYKKASEKPVAKPSVSTDKGTTTVETKPKTEIRPGTLREVFSQLRAQAGIT